MADLPPSVLALLRRYGDPGPQSGIAATPAYGTQAAPLDSFYSASGATGNKTTNKDLPAWLRAIGMKGDAYAGGFLKPEIRYGFAYKNGKIYFADGTSFAATRDKKANTYSYTGADGKAATYSPTDEQNAYNKAYKASTSNQSFLDKATNAVKFELWHGKQILQGIGSNPKQLVFGIDPIGTKIGNGVFGDDAKPLVDQFGGALGSRYAEYGRPTGFAKPLQGVAHAVAAFYAAGGLQNAAGNIGQSIGSSGTGEGLGIFSNGGAGGIGSVGASNAGNLAAAGGIAGGAGIGGTSGALGAGVGASTGGGMAGWTDWIGPAINAGASILGNAAAAHASDKSTAAIINENRRQFDLVRSDTAPQRALGNAAIGNLANLYGYNESGTPDMSGFFASPDYNFNLSEGQNAIDRSAAARGGLLSGAAVKEGTRYASGLASREYSGFVDRLMQQAGIGSTGIGASAAAGANATGNISNAYQNNGNARASAYLGAAQGVNNSIQGGLSNQLLSRYLNG